MAKLAGFKIPQQAMTGAIMGVFTPILVWLVSLFENLAQTIITMIQSGRAGIITGTAIGNRIIQTLGGQWALTMPDVLVAALGGAVVVMVGTWIYNMKWSPDTIPGLKPTPTTKLTLVLFYAALAATLALSAFALPALPVLIVMLINALVTAWFAVAVLRKQLNLI